MAGFNDILNPAPRSSGRSSNGHGSSEQQQQQQHQQQQQQQQYYQQQQQQQHQHQRRPSLSPANSYEDVHHGEQAHHGSYQHQRQQRPGSSSRRSHASIDMSLDISQANAAAASRPSHIPMPSPSGGMSRTSISNLLGDSVESPRSRLIASGASSPADDNRRALHPHWPPGSGPASAPPGTETATPSAGVAGHGMSFLLNHGTAGAVVVERKNSRSASSSSSHGPPPGGGTHLGPPGAMVTPGPSSTADTALGRTTSAPAAIPGSPSGSISEASTGGGTAATPGGRTFVNRIFGFFRNKEGAVSPQTQPAIPPHMGGAGPSGAAAAPPPPLPPGASSSRMPYNHSPSGGSLLSLPMTPGTPHSPAEHHPYPAAQAHPYHHSQHPQPHHSQGLPPSGYSTGTSGEYSRRPLPPAGYVDGVEYSPTLVVHNGHQHQHQHGPHPSYHPPAHHNHHHPAATNRASLSPTAVVQGLPPPGATGQYPPSADQLGQRMHPHPPHLAPGAGSDMSPPPVPASTARTAGAAAKRSASTSSLAVPEASEGASSAAAAVGGASGSKKRSRTANRGSATPASSRPTSPTDSLSVAPSPAVQGQPASVAAAADVAASAAPVAAAAVLPPELRDPKVNIKRLPPPKFANLNTTSPGAQIGALGGGAGVLGGIENPSPRTPIAPKDWMSSGMISAAVGLATGLDGGAGAAAATAAATAALKIKEQEEKEKQQRALERQKEKEKEKASAVVDGHAEGPKQSAGGGRRKSSSASTKRNSDATAVAAAAGAPEADETRSRAASSSGGSSALKKAGWVPYTGEAAEEGSASAVRTPTAKKKRENSTSSGNAQTAAAAAAGAGADADPMDTEPDPTVSADSPVVARPRTSSAGGPLDSNPYSFTPKQRTASTSSAATTSLSQRRLTMEHIQGSSAPAPPPQPVKIENPIPYDPHRRTPRTTIRRPIYPHEIEEIKARHRNPLRWKYEEEMAGLVNSTANGSSDARARAGTEGSRNGSGSGHGNGNGNGNGHGPARTGAAATAPSRTASSAGLPSRPGPPPPLPSHLPASTSTSANDHHSPSAGKRKREENGYDGGAGGERGSRERERDSGMYDERGRERDRNHEPAAKRRPGTGGITKGPDNNEVSEHYNSRKEVGVIARKDSKIYPLKKFNNWAKNLLIQRFSNDGCRVLDMGCGKGGDLNKWARARASTLIMIDIAGMSVGQAETRYREQRHRYEAEFYTFDCFARALSDVVPTATLAPKFDNITLQFCMHYGWASVAKARCLLENVSRYLRPGGHFIGTIPDADNLLQRLNSLKGDELTFGNEYYHVTFEQKERQPPFGNKYWFFLEDAVDEVPEYVVDWEQFESLAAEFGLRLVYRRTFAQMYHDAAMADGNSHLADRESREDLIRMGVKMPRYEGDVPMQKDLWDAVCLYLGFAFQRVED
ncbi:mRNA cap guanine-N7 methyltransferase [Tilletia horrida]|uniref:mRNA cap guanine-N(7) methyltransferase n=1 Tax=Tilletia horrida TaxID=155126 RepID=A0AAN6GES1_9BASI|nr:mRNA cap guanine-N7 methyltransferase [Tilletia horrida]